MFLKKEKDKWINNNKNTNKQFMRHLYIQIEFKLGLFGS